MKVLLIDEAASLWPTLSGLLMKKGTSSGYGSVTDVLRGISGDGPGFALLDLPSASACGGRLEGNGSKSGGSDVWTGVAKEIASLFAGDVRGRNSKGGGSAALRLDRGNRVVCWRGKELSGITRREFELLYALVSDSPRVLSRQEIVRNVWRTFAVDNLVDVHLHNLRKKLPGSLAVKLRVVPGDGFKYVP